jgi:hypothetical protein
MEKSRYNQINASDNKINLQIFQEVVNTDSRIGINIDVTITRFILEDIYILRLILSWDIEYLYKDRFYGR